MDVLVVGVRWQLRALLRAQLIEAGCEVVAVASWAEAERLCRWQAYRPDAAALDVEDADTPETMLTAASRYIPPNRVLVLTTPLAFDPARAHALGFSHVLAKPYSIGDAVERLLTLARVSPKPEA